MNNFSIPTRASFRTLLISIFVCLFWVRGHGQTKTFDLSSELAKRDVADVAQEVEMLAADDPDSARVLFMLAILETDAQKAVELYNKVKVAFPKSEFASDAIFQIGQYYLSRGLYVSARGFFLEIVEEYPDSKWEEDAVYFAAVCLCAARKDQPCEDELRNFVSKYRSSSLARLAREDLRSLGAQTSASIIAQTEAARDGRYTLQVGAFGEANRALNLRSYFEKLGFSVQIRERIEQGKKLFVVQVGSFRTQNQARVFGENLKRDHGKPYRIVAK